MLKISAKFIEVKTAKPANTRFYLKIALLALILPLSISTITYAKALHVQGTILDAQTGQPVPSATVSVPARNFFYPADGEGKFSIDENSLAGTDTLNVSCIGYQTAKMMIKDVVVDGTIRLSPMVNVLNEITVGYKLTKVGSSLKSGWGSASYLPGMEVGMFMVGSAGHSGIIKSVGFYLGNGGNLIVPANGDVRAPFRTRIYAADSLGMPGKEMTKDIIIVSAKKNNQWFDVDVSGYQLEAPENGFFVSFSLLDAAYYKVNAKFQDQNGHVGNSWGVFTPHLALSKNESTELLTYRHVHTRDGILKWLKDASGNNCLMRAVIVGN